MGNSLNNRNKTFEIYLKEKKEEPAENQKYTSFHVRNSYNRFYCDSFTQSNVSDKRTTVPAQYDLIKEQTRSMPVRSFMFSTCTPSKILPSSVQIQMQGKK